MPEFFAEPVQAGAPRYAFVYGTLRRGEVNDITRLSPSPVYIGRAHISGRMYHLGAYPGVRLGLPNVVTGEVYGISAELEVRLDEIEFIYPQQSDEYAKREVNVNVNGQTLCCLVYEINLDHTVGKPLIASGDWVLREQ
jgi:gamma-glutamylcyclotransferase (GGCT)/AIG2-like uncharacterized protein YtfP